MGHQRSIPAGAIETRDELSDAVAYLHGDAEICAVVFHGRRSKPVVNHRFNSEAERDQAIARSFAARRATQAKAIQHREARKAWRNDYRVGEILRTRWGYDQTNSEFYEIVAITGKKLTLRRLAVESVETGWAHQRVAPLAGSYAGEPFERLAQEHGIRIGFHVYAHRLSFEEPVSGVRIYALSDVSQTH